jgi:hypothetical protein
LWGKTAVIRQLELLRIEWDERIKEGNFTVWSYDPWSGVKLIVKDWMINEMLERKDGRMNERKKN